MRQQPIVICGPSGSGKSTLLKRLLAENKDRLAFTISHTTRKPRKGEQDGKEYYFITREEMERMISNCEFIEHTEFSGNYYGTSKRAVQDALKTGKLFILEVDIEGVKALHELKGFKPIFIFIKPPSKQLLIERLSSRGTESVDALKRRLDRADEEMKFAESGAVQFDLVLVNDDLDETYGKYFPQLEALSISGSTKITGGGIEILAEQARQLKVLDLSWCSRITDASLECIACDLGDTLTDLILPKT